MPGAGRRPEGQIRHMFNLVRYDTLRSARAMGARAYRSLLPLGVRRELWYLRHTGRTYAASMPRRYTPYRDWDGQLPTREAAQASASHWRTQLGIGEAGRGKTSIIIVTYNSLNYTRLTLKSILEKTAYPDYEIVVVDNGSEPEVKALLLAAAAEHPNVRVMFNERNAGFAAANNIGFRLTARESRYLVLLNNDTIVTPGWLATLVEHLQDPRAGLVGPVTNFIGNEARIRVPYRALDEIDAFALRSTCAHRGQTFEIPMLAMYCLALRREVAEELGPLDERFGVGLFEDDDYALRAHEAGYNIICARDAFVHHFGNASFSKLGEERNRAIFEENRRRFEEKWGRPYMRPRMRRRLRDTLRDRMPPSRRPATPRQGV